MSATRIRLVTRGDDAGSSGNANRALVEACARGILRNVSIMVPGPAFDGAVELFAGQTDVCLGLHVTLNAEWVWPRWGPVLPPERVPSLVDDGGAFFPSPDALNERGVYAEHVRQMVAEAQAQLDLARSRGLAISYLDEHMGVGRLPGLRDALARLAEREGLVDGEVIPALPRVATQVHGPPDGWLLSLAAAAPGAYVLITHPGYDDDELRGFHNGDYRPGMVARDRDRERRALLDPRMRAICESADIACVRYTDVLTGGTRDRKARETRVVPDPDPMTSA